MTKHALSRAADLSPHCVVLPLICSTFERLTDNLSCKTVANLPGSAAETGHDGS